MTEELLSVLRCPVTGSKLTLHIVSRRTVVYAHIEPELIWDAVLLSESCWLYPVINGVPRLIVEAFIDYETFLNLHISDFLQRRSLIIQQYGELVNSIVAKNRKTKQSFGFEWSRFNYSVDKTWDAGKDQMINRFLAECDETTLSIQGKLILDAGCGNGILSQYIAESGAEVIAIDFSRSVETASHYNKQYRVNYIQADISYPPFQPSVFDIVQCSGVLVHTPDPKFSFNEISKLVKPYGKLSVWLYHPQKSAVHKFLVWLRIYVSRLSLPVQYRFLQFTLFPVSFIIKKIKGNKQTAREMMTDLLDHFTPQYRWEFTHDIPVGWFKDLHYTDVQITTVSQFGFNITGVKPTAI